MNNSPGTSGPRIGPGSKRVQEAINSTENVNNNNNNNNSNTVILLSKDGLKYLDDHSIHAQFSKLISNKFPTIF